jgi:mono/diheme cytochrome c family protein
MRKTLARATAGLAIAGALVSVDVVRSENPRPPQRSVPASPERQAIMRSHYFEVVEVHEALIRGDLKAIAAPAKRLAALTPATPVPAEFSPFVTALKTSAARVAEATTIDGAARATTDLLAQCAGCHRSAGIRPPTPSRVTPDVGGMVGHMLEHQRATDELLLGLLLPSASVWDLGAGRLNTGELRPNELPRDPKMSDEAKKADEKIHKLAADAAAAGSSPARRDAMYVEVVTACAQCHGLHPNIWGPNSTR